MNVELNVLNPEDIRNTLIIFLKNKSLIPIVGAGFSGGLDAYRGRVPNGSEYKNQMINELSKNEEFNDEEKASFLNDDFSTLSDYYEDDENVSQDVRLSYLKNNFCGVNMPIDDIRHLFFKIEWPYIYSLNIDDAIENSSLYRRIVLPNREVNDEIFDEEKCVIKLHGDIGEIVTYKRGDKIFTSKEYALSLEKNAYLLNKLRNDYKNQNIIFIGCSLDDEIDLKTLSTWPFDHTEKDNLSRRIIFVKGKPGKRQKSKYKVYGITDVVCFDDYDKMYVFLSNIWEEAIKIQEDELEQYTGIKICSIGSAEREKNHDYFFWGKSLYDLKNATMNFPYFFVTRNTTLEILKNINENKVHLVYGTRLSGKSYLLADLYKTIRDREVFYFDGRSRITKNALVELLKKENIVALFDIGTLDREQLEYILQSASDIKVNHNNIIINVNYHDSDTLGIVQLKLKHEIIQTSDILRYTLSNKLIDHSGVKELEKVNKLLPAVNIPPYKSRSTFLDQLLYSESILNKKGKFSSQHIKVQSNKQLALLIVLAIREKLYALDIINFGFDMEIVDAIKRYAPFIERVETYSYEKSASDLSSVKYILNSKYWLKRELGNYARKKENYKNVNEAYYYIIGKIIEFSGKDEYKQRRECRKYILFDIMNDIFLDKYHGSIKLIVNVYTKLHSLLANDFNFLHQNAKCYLNYARYLREKSEKIQYLDEAKELAIIAKTMTENKYEESSNERLLITTAHIQYTLATIYCVKCKECDYEKTDENEIAIDAAIEAIYSPYNGDSYQTEKAQGVSHGILDFIRYVATNYKKLGLSKEYYRKSNELLSFIVK